MSASNPRAQDVPASASAAAGGGARGGILRRLRRLPRLLLGRRPVAARPVTAAADAGEALPVARRAVLRVHSELWDVCEAHVRDVSVGEQAGVLLLRAHEVRPGDGPVIVTAVGFLLIGEEYVTDRRHGLSYDGRFHLYASRVAQREHAGMLLLHAHGDDPHPQPSTRDRTLGGQFLAFASRRAAHRPHGLAVLGGGAVAVRLQLGDDVLELDHVDVVGVRRQRWRTLPWHGAVDEPQVGPGVGPGAGGLHAARTAPAYEAVDEVADEGADTAADEGADGADRQELAFGADSIRLLTTRTVGVVGLSGGGSHVQQQLIHAGVGTVVVNDRQKVSATNLRRLVGAVAGDVDVTDKVDVAVRTAAAVRPEVRIVPVLEAFPAAAARAELRTCDVIIGCVDDWATRDMLNTFCLEHRIPYIDIGAAITAGSSGPRVSGQVVVVLPGGPCLRDMGLVTEARVEAARQRALGYLDGEPEPQVVSINGTLASEAVTAALLLLATAAASLEARRRYAYPPGKLVPVATQIDPLCVPCRQHGLR
jgi:molybdopterin/thiamine biosynthesis adenylyltransferase